ncbi:sugar ABC transporter substrate-binding protein [Glaciihabitans sp. UYNi722]|uniref:ABC transporter substrate-binding protein n=1 Tax=Glaciihabitans sp. UYNi722 TaxID=3156344 RepID=UPI003395E161
MKHLKSIGTAAVLTAAALVLAGCSGGGSSGPVTINYAIWDQSQAPTFQKMISVFEKENPDIKVNLQVTASAQYMTKLQTEAGNNALPDVFWMNPFNFPLYASQGAIQPINDQVKKAGFDANAIPAAMRDIYTYEGKLYALPNNRDDIVVWYNKALFKAAGLSDPTAGWTWADYQKDAAALTDASKGVWGTAVPIDFRDLFVNTVHQAGGSILSADKKTAQWGTSAVQQGMQYWADMSTKGYSPSVDQLSSTDQNSLLLSGKVAMIYAGSWMGVTFKNSQLAKDGKLGVAVLPKGPKNDASSTSSLGNLIPAKAKHPDQSYKFVQFLGSKEAGDIYTEGGIAFSAYPSADKNFVNYFSSAFDAQPIADQLKNTFNLPVSLNSPVWQSDITANLAPVIKGSVSVSDGLKKMNTDMQGALDKEATQ